MHVHKFLCFKACGIEDPGQDDQPVMRASTISYCKKGISHFFHSTQKWNENSETGNPTYSNMVNNLIKVVTKQETRGNGAESQADRALTANEYYQVLELFQGDDRHTAMTNFQHHLMARMDDVAHVKKETLKVSSCAIDLVLRIALTQLISFCFHEQASAKFNGYLTTKISWSKNVRDQSNCPVQLMLPDMDPRTCVYLSLALFLEDDIQYCDGAPSQWLLCSGSTAQTTPTDQQDKEANNGKARHFRK